MTLTPEQLLMRAQSWLDANPDDARTAAEVAAALPSMVMGFRDELAPDGKTRTKVQIMGDGTEVAL